ncbi:MAG: hypothetical protein DLM55_12000 [Acidimicrobiales bacterium]|nr:MAG: hypothetical protein DLM55_12000 [Acidimicrobiales bacterium]
MLVEIDGAVLVDIWVGLRLQGVQPILKQRLQVVSLDHAVRVTTRCFEDLSGPAIHCDGGYRPNIITAEVTIRSGFTELFRSLHADIV